VESLRQTVALSLLERQSPASRLEGVTWSSQVQRPDRDLLSALISTLQTDPNTNVRLAALDALEKFSGDPQVREALINAVGHEDSPLVQIALIDTLVRLRDKKATGELKKLSTETDANAAVRQRAQWALQTLRF
jgi:HEAT repeat protein